MSDLAAGRLLGEALVAADDKDPTQRTQPVTRRKATVTAYDSATHTCTLSMGGALVAGCESILQYFPIVGDEVWVDLMGKKPLVMGPAGIGRWIPMTLGTGYSQYPSYTPHGYRRLASGHVELRGTLLVGAGAAATIFTLPVGFRAVTAGLRGSVYHNAVNWTACALYILGGGEIQNAPVPVNGSIIMLDGVIFSIGA